MVLSCLKEEGRFLSYSFNTKPAWHLKPLPPLLYPCILSRNVVLLQGDTLVSAICQVYSFYRITYKQTNRDYNFIITDNLLTVVFQFYSFVPLYDFLDWRGCKEWFNCLGHLLYWADICSFCIMYTDSGYLKSSSQILIQ